MYNTYLRPELVQIKEFFMYELTDIKEAIDELIDLILESQEETEQLAKYD